MALPSTGSISMYQVRNELKLSGAISLNNGTVRALAGRASGAISMSHLRGKSALELRTVYSAAIGDIRGFADSSTSTFGSISNASYGGRTIALVYVYGSKPSDVTVGISGTTSPGWTKVWINGTSYSLRVWNSFKDGMGSGFTMTNAHSIFGSNFTIGFS